jgi:hypothetical protein
MKTRIINSKIILFYKYSLIGVENHYAE